MTTVTLALFSLSATGSGCGPVLCRPSEKITTHGSTSLTSLVRRWSRILSASSRPLVMLVPFPPEQSLNEVTSAAASHADFIGRRTSARSWKRQQATSNAPLLTGAASS